MTHMRERAAPEVAAGAGFAVVGLALGYVTGQALQVAATLGLADLVATGPQPLAALAAATNADAPALYRVLRTLCSVGVFAEDAEGRFTQTPLSAPLCSDAPGSIRAAVRWVSAPMHYRSVGHMLQTVLTGRPAFDDLFGNSYFDYLARHPEAGRVWDAGMACLGGLENQSIAQAYTFPSGAQIVDVGGGQGGFLAEVLTANPLARGVLYDLPAVVADPRLLTEAGVSERAEAVGGDFFEFLPPGGDVYVFKRVLHDWDDETCVELLQSCRRVIPDGGRVLIIDAVIAPGNAPHAAKIVDLVMLNIVRGRERTAAEFGQLLTAAGFRLNQVIPTPSMLSIVEGRPIGSRPFPGPYNKEGSMSKDAVSVAPDFYKVVLENDRVRVLEVRGAPGAKTELHVHPAQVVVALSDGQFRFGAPDGQSREAGLKAGQVMFLDPVEHTSEITGSTEAHLLLIELK